MLNVIAVGALLLLSSVVAPPVHSAAEAPPTGRITIDKLKVNGSGCRHQTTTTAVSPDNEAFTVLYSTYLAQSGGGAKPQDGTKNCSITVRLNVPAGITYAVAAVDYRGFAQLHPGVTARQWAGYKFQGPDGRTESEHRFPAGFDDSWQVTNIVPANALVFGPCGKDRKLDIDTQLSLQTARPDPAAPVSIIAMDSTDGEFRSTYRLAWRSCP